MPPMDSIMARDLLMLKLLLMPSMVPMAMALTMVTHMPTMDMHMDMEKDLLMLRPLLMPSMEPMVMVLTMAMVTMLMVIMDTLTMDSMDIHMLMDSTDIINLFIC